MTIWHGVKIPFVSLIVLIPDRNPELTCSLLLMDKTVLCADGNHLLSACHPRALTFVKHSTMPQTYFSPCEVIRFENVLNRSWHGQRSRTLPTLLGSTVYLDAVGDEFSACSVAAVVSGKMWIGAVHDRGLLGCSI